MMQTHHISILLLLLALLAGRGNCAVVPAELRHRLVVSCRPCADQIDSDALIERLLADVKTEVPR